MIKNRLLVLVFGVLLLIISCSNMPTPKRSRFVKKELSRLQGEWLYGNDTTSFVVSNDTLVISSLLSDEVDIYVIKDIIKADRGKYKRLVLEDGIGYGDTIDYYYSFKKRMRTLYISYSAYESDEWFRFEKVRKKKFVKGC